ncbi:hypothetical protein CICLE_v10010102mg [Citrus x clementina]|uniref:Uncharacterized protein n=1 Tax=Citrus clementina TaxID=85681 RepID=V4URG9_CITCL|nr:hypothetical protein CICLE_v10010102mg [Citrus x clementina]
MQCQIVSFCIILQHSDIIQMKIHNQPLKCNVGLGKKIIHLSCYYLKTPLKIEAKVVIDLLTDKNDIWRLVK